MDKKSKNTLIVSIISLVGGAGTTYFGRYTAEMARIDGGTSSPGYFTAK